MREHYQDSNTHGDGEVQIIGVTRDPVLRPAGTVLMIVGTIWALFWGMAVDAGTFGQPLAAASLVCLGALAAGVGKREEQI
jgi:hypothetical protein